MQFSPQRNQILSWHSGECHIFWLPGDSCFKDKFIFLAWFKAETALRRNSYFSLLWGGNYCFFGLLWGGIFIFRLLWWEKPIFPLLWGRNWIFRKSYFQVALRRKLHFQVDLRRNPFRLFLDTIAIICSFEEEIETSCCSCFEEKMPFQGWFEERNSVAL